MNPLPTVDALPMRIFRRACRTGWIALALLALALVLAGCRSEAEDRNYDFNNPLDPNQDTGTGTGTGTGQLVIAEVNIDPGIVIVVNEGTEDTDMSGWTLENDNATPAKYTFSGFTLIAGRFVRLHTRTGSNTGTSTSLDIYTDPEALNWGPVSPNNVARLKNAGGTTIFTCQVGNTCWN